ncbi:hypothetical protein [Paenibacillus contaminans]|uniref:Uncharacterized protein n=1 Tax=Paenibacillus contaminans TaxID=450362 RepID=A0A329MXZ6_9BACL|nr:hypothetical protein [Paenibacillus contaminans]RAV23193.1 hypothetical protein DQG23_03090 [Paenibacillus contaminans]
MGERVLVFLLTAAAALIAGMQDWKGASRKVRLVFVLIMLYAGYTGYGYIVDKTMPNLPDGVTFAFEKLAVRIDKVLKPQTIPDPSKHKEDSADE